MTSNDKQRYHGDEDVIRRNVEQSRKLIEARRQRGDGDDIEIEDIAAPANASEDAPPGQSNTPIGGQTGPNERGGTSKKHKAG